MKLIYCRESDSLYIDLSSRPGVQSREISDGVVADFDKKGDIVGIDIDKASCRVDLNDVILSASGSRQAEVGQNSTGTNGVRIIRSRVC